MQDRRVTRTQHLLADALVLLSAEKGYEAVSIRDITERANVGYATFFRHYRTKEALLVDVLAEIIQALIQRLQPMTARGRLHEAGRQLFEYVAEHRALLRMFLAAQGSPEIQALLHETVVQQILATRPIPPDSPIPPEIAVYHLITASTALIQWWLEHDLPYSPERMGQIYALLVVQPIRGEGGD